MSNLPAASVDNQDDCGLEDASDQTWKKCKQHNNPCLFVCMTCKEQVGNANVHASLCVECTEEDHDGKEHKIVKIDKFVDESMRSEMISYSAQLKKFCKIIEKLENEKPQPIGVDEAIDQVRTRCLYLKTNRIF